LDSVWGEATLNFTYTATLVGETAVLVCSVLRDTPHARVSVSYVLEASLLNDRCQQEVRWELEANSTRASLRESIAQGSMPISSLCNLCVLCVSVVGDPAS